MTIRSCQREQIAADLSLFFRFRSANFDTHTKQLPIHAQLLSELSQALWAFHNAPAELGISQDVRTFTYTE